MAAVLCGSGHFDDFVRMAMANAPTEVIADRRVVRTREVLLAAFLDLLFERGYEALSVGDIVAKANVGRSTFYEHFAGKDELLRFSLRQPFSMLAAIVGANEVRGETLRVLQHFHARRKRGSVLFAWPMRPHLGRALSDLIEERLVSLYPTTEGTVGRRAGAHQIAEAQLALVDQWISGRITCGVDALAEALHATTNAVVRSLRFAPGLP